MDRHEDRFPPKCYVDGLLYRPPLEEVRAYYSRTDVLDELLGGMRRWHVRLEPGEGLRHRWINVTDRQELRAMLLRPLDRMARNPRRVKFPYLRIDARRYEPVTSWEPDDRWGLDFVLEKDGPTWRECWDAVLPVTAILDHFGVHYWLKYTGHHSLHVLMPAESVPARLGRLPLLEYLPSIRRRLLAFFRRCCFQPLGEGGSFHGSPGTNMPYALNEDTGLLNYPILKREIPAFQPVQAHPSGAAVRSFWREFPHQKRGSAAALLAEALRPFREQKCSLPGLSARPPVGLDQTLAQMESRQRRQRKEAVLRLPWFGEPEAADRLLGALNDRALEVRKAAVEAVAGVDDPRCEWALRKMLPGTAAKLSSWIEDTLKLIADLETLRGAGS